MLMFQVSARSILSISILCLLCARGLTASQTASGSQAGGSGNGYRIAGTVVSKTDRHPLARARIFVRDAKDEQKFESLVTAEDGKFDFRGLPAGKYSLAATKRGYINAAYDQHDQFSTAIVTGAGLDTEALVLRLAPAAVITGKVLDESGEPVRHATVTAYFDDHSTGIDQIRQARGTQTDDQGAYEIPSLAPGTYFLSTNAKPWYAVHPRSNPPTSGPQSEPADPANFDRSVDVAYPLTYYPDATETDSAMPIPIRGGERLQVEIHLNPVPSLHLLFRVPNNGNNRFTVPQLEQPSFDGSTYLENDGAQMVSPGLVELAGVPAGRYNVRLNGSGSPIQMNGVDFTKDGEEINTTTSETLSSVKVSVKIVGETTLPARLSVGLRSAHRRPERWQEFDAKGEADLEQLSPGQYEVFAWGPPKPYSIAHISAEGASVSGHSLTLASGSSVSVSLTLVGGSSNIEGTAKRAGKPFAGAMVVLVPKDPEMNRDLFRRDQSDLDGTFSLRNVVPDTYTVLAIDNGWELDWSQPGVIAAYLSQGRTLDVGKQAGRTVSLSEAVEVQSK
jgi:hypothetical protein